LNEIDENVYETEQAKINSEKENFTSKPGLETIEDVTDELEKDIVDETNKETEKTLNNFSSNNMEKLEEIDPWMKRKMEQESEEGAEGGAEGGGGSKED